MNSRVDAFIEKSGRWQAELEKLREILLDCMLVEDFKWGAPCYTWHKANVVGMHGFKEHFALWFFRGSLLNDTYKLLVRPGESTQVLRQMRFTSMEEVVEKERQIREYLLEAIEAEKAGVKIEYKKTELVIPPEFQAKMDEIPELAEAFARLTPGRQKQYCQYFAEAKQEKTRRDRIEKYIPQIIGGEGLVDRYMR
ncbi:MAG: YdeI/OmpD-associated family protein [Bacteroidota bacterium]